jgi:ElaB/YqjD/DUF883 family membrane-anchored ribosome-binding protein
VLALINSGDVLGEDFKNKLEELKKGLLELPRHRVIRREIITNIDTIINLLIQYNNLLNSKKEEEKLKLENLKNQINSLSGELKVQLSNILKVLESVFLDNLRNFLLNLHLAKSALEDPEAKSFGAVYLLYLNILNGVYQSIDSVLRKFPRYEDIETRRAGKFFSFDEFLNYLIERISEALKALEALEGIEDKENIRRRLEKNLQDLKQKLEELTRENL